MRASKFAILMLQAFPARITWQPFLLNHQLRHSSYCYCVYKLEQVLDITKSRHEAETPRRIKVLPATENIKWNVSAGHGFSFLYASNSCHCHAEGLNYYGQLAQGYSSCNQQTDSPVYIKYYQQSKFRGGPSNQIVRHVACGRAHSILVSSKDVLASGLNTLGQCGLSGEDIVTKFRSSAVEDKMPLITKVCCGFDHSLLLTSHGKVFSAGLGSDGQTGLGTFDPSYQFKKVKFKDVDTRIVDIAAAADTSVALAEDGSLYGWGNNEYQQISDDTEETQIASPALIKTYDRETLSEIGCGGTFVNYVTARGDIYVKGYTTFKASANGTLTPGFRRLDIGKRLVPVRMKSGPDYIAVQLDKRNLVTFGLVKRLRLTGQIGNTDGQLHMQLPGTIEDFACGVDSVVVVVKEEKDLLMPEHS